MKLTNITRRKESGARHRPHNFHNLTESPKVSVRQLGNIYVKRHFKTDYNTDCITLARFSIINLVLHMYFLKELCHIIISLLISIRVRRVKKSKKSKKSKSKKKSKNGNDDSILFTIDCANDANDDHPRLSR